MDEILIPSLEDFTLVKLSVLLWDHTSILEAVEVYSTAKGIKKNDEWLQVRNRVIKKVQDFVLPGPLKEKLLSSIERVGWEMTVWIFYHKDEWNYLPPEPNRFCWTFIGVIDKVKMAKKLVHDERLHVVKRYRLACIYCFEEDIFFLWTAMFDGEPVVTVAQLLSDKHPLVKYWTRNLKDGVNIMQSALLEDGLLCAVFSGSEVATKYFIENMPHNILDDVLWAVIFRMIDNSVYGYRYAQKENRADVIHILLSIMNKDHLRSMYEECKLNLLNSLLYWPWQDHFIQIALSLFEVVPDFRLEELLRSVTKNALHGYRDCDYVQLCVELWKKSPVSMRRSATSANCFPFLVSNLFDVEAETMLALILKEATAYEKKLLLLCTKGKFICIKLVRKENWDLLHLLLYHCVAGMSGHDLTCLKEQLVERQQLEPFLHPSSYTAGQETIWKKFFHLLDEYIAHTENNTVQSKEVVN